MRSKHKKQLKTKLTHAQMRTKIKRLIIYIIDNTNKFNKKLLIKILFIKITLFFLQ